MPEESKNENWSEFYQNTAGSPPQETLLKALDIFDKNKPHGEPRLAVDLGCGAGRDTFELLRRGWKVLAVDSTEEALEYVKSGVSQANKRLEILLMSLEDLELDTTAELINASYSLPFCAPENFAAMWNTIVNAIKPGGRFSGHFFGDKDQWVKHPLDVVTTHHTRAQVEEFIKDFEVEFFHEKSEQGFIANGDPKYWHAFSVVAKRKE